MCSAAGKGCSYKLKPMLYTVRQCLWYTYHTDGVNVKMMHTYTDLSVMFFMQESLKGVQLYTSYLEESERKAGQRQLGDINEAETNFQHCRSVNTAICIDTANFWLKSKIANPKAVKMNLTTWLQLLLGCCYRN